LMKEGLYILQLPSLQGCQSFLLSVFLS
jgi:hypothetical protein